MVGCLDGCVGTHSASCRIACSDLDVRVDVRVNVRKDNLEFTSCMFGRRGLVGPLKEE